MPTAFKITTSHDGLSKGLPLFKQDTNMPKFGIMDKIKEALINRARYYLSTWIVGIHLYDR